MLSMTERGVGVVFLALPPTPGGAAMPHAPLLSCTSRAPLNRTARVTPVSRPGPGASWHGLFRCAYSPPRRVWRMSAPTFYARTVTRPHASTHADSSLCAAHHGTRVRWRSVYYHRAPSLHASRPGLAPSQDSGHGSCTVARTHHRCPPHTPVSVGCSGSTNATYRPTTPLNKHQWGLEHEVSCLWRKRTVLKPRGRPREQTDIR